VQASSPATQPSEARRADAVGNEAKRSGNVTGAESMLSVRTVYFFRAGSARLSSSTMQFD
jgi:hypothetical protein